MKIGVFDSGVGGKTFVRAIESALPDAEVLLRDDVEHLPYGTKSPDEVFGYVVPILKGLAEDGCQVIVVACNTVSTNLIGRLRAVISVPLVAVEPMVKPAAEQTKSGVIAVCATPATLKSDRYKWLKDNYARGVKVIEPDCSNWASMIEDKEVDRRQIHDTIDAVCLAGADVIVLGCTHYHWIENIIKKETEGRAVVIQPEKPVVEQLKRVIEQLA